MAATDVVPPPDQSEGTTHQIGQWLKQVGDPVQKDEPLLEIITDKVTVEIAAPADGVLTEILKSAGDEDDERGRARRRGTRARCIPDRRHGKGRPDHAAGCGGVRPANPRLGGLTADSAHTDAQI